MTTTHVNNFTNFGEMVDHLRVTAAAAAGVEGADDVGAFHPIVMADKYRAYGEFSSLSEYLDDFADVLAEFLNQYGDELSTWSA